MILSKIRKLICMLLLISAFIVPTSAYASTNTNQTSSHKESFQIFSISNLINIFKSNNNEKDYEDHYFDNRDDWWICFWTWWGHDFDDHDGDDSNQCQYNHDGWSNDNGCLSSDEIWKKWYCH